MADHHRRHHHHEHRPHRLSVPPRTGASRPYPPFPYTPTPTPSKLRLSSSLSFNSKSNNKSSSLSFPFLLLLSLRSLYSLLPFLRSSPSFSLFPFSFLVSLLSFFLTLSFSFSPSSFSFSFSSITPSQLRSLASKSLLLALLFLLRFQALRYCGAAPMILAEFAGTVAGRVRTRNRTLRGFVPLFLGLLILSLGWDQVECFPRLAASGNCVKIWPMLLPFLSGCLGCCYERVSSDRGTIRQLSRKQVRLITLFFTTLVLFVPAVISFLFFESKQEDGVVVFGNLLWPLVGTVVFGVLLSENFSDDEKLVSSRDSRREFLVTFVCTLVLELYYFPQLSLWGLLLSGLLLYVAVRELDPFRRSGDLGSGEESSELLSGMIMKPVRHILSERKSRKIALFLLINTGYMVVEFVAGFMSNSLGLISDACHMLFDCAALAIGLYASYISRLPANSHYNYGRGRFEVLSGYANAVFLVLVGALIVVESLERILDPQEISTNSLLIVSIGGLMVNVVGLIFFHEEHHHAHGGSGSCSHSHSHSHSQSNSHHHHDHAKHHCEGHGSNQELVSVSSDFQDNLCSSDSDHHHYSHQKIHADNHSNQHAKNHDHHDHDHTHHHDHDHHHDHTHRHDHGDYRDQNSHQHHHHHHHDADHHCHEASVVPHLEVHNVARSHCEVVCSSTENFDSQQKKTLSNAKEPQEHSHHHIDHNMEGIFLHVLADTMGSVGVVISTLLIKYKGWLVADPACSIFISVLIISSVIPLLRNSAEVLLQRVPRVHEHKLKIALTDVLTVKGVYGIQKFHAWSFTNTDVVGTLHLHLSADTDKASTKSQVSNLLYNAGIKDLTVQVESVS
ncbi:hypothetical protein RIF29_36020 [Crotalaria pallida]|uniref:Cation efflux protein transmembrane domain-containing protein n=1 Tax=Crotalaria pallida TaxID=3830 RepID=A0AAN9HYA5_CROPI